jgi:hypothetical protein
MLNRQSSDPEVIVGDSSALSVKLLIDGRVMEDGVLISKNNGDAGLSQESQQKPLIVGSSTAQCETGAKFCQYDESEHNLASRAKHCDDAWVAALKVAVPVAVERNPHGRSDPTFQD